MFIRSRQVYSLIIEIGYTVVQSQKAYMYTAYFTSKQADTDFWLCWAIQLC